MRRIILSATTALLGLHTLAQAQTPTPSVATLADTIVTATRVPTPAERVPASITVLTRRDIEERGYQTLSEALQFVPGVRLAPLGGIGQQSTAFLRGNSGRSTLVLLDGVPINDVSEPNGSFNFGNDLLFDIERVEVVRGPASSLYGSAALGGVINLVTRRAPADRAVQAFGEAAGGSQRTFRGGVGAGGTVGAFDYLGTVANLSTQGSNAIAPRFNQSLAERDGFRGTAATARLGFAPIPGTRVEGTLRWRENVFGLDNPGRDDPNYNADDRRWFGQLRGETQLFGGVWTSGLRAFRTEDRRRFTNLPDSLSRATNDDLFRGSRTGADWGNIVRLPGFGALDQGALSFGAAYAREEANSRSGNAPFRVLTNASQDTVAGHASLQYRLFQRLDLTAGFRHDEVGSFGETTWRVGAVLQAPELNARVRAAAGSGFNAPSLFQRFGTIGNTFRGNPSLRPERSTGWELGAELDVPALGRRDFATLGATFFQSRVEDQIVFRGSSLANIDRADIEGAELLLALRPARWLQGELAWTITDARDARTDRPLPRRPEHVLSATARIAPVERLVIAPQLLVTGRSPEAAFASYRDDGTSFATERRNKSGTVVNVSASYQFRPQVAGFVEARNLGNARFEPANGFVIPGRSVLAGARFVF